jgi:hypothetical protein
LAQSGHGDRAQQCPLLGVKRTSGKGRFSFTCAPSASRDCADERAFHLLLNALHRTSADANLAGNFDDAVAGPQLILDALFDGCADPRPSERLARLDSPLEAGVDIRLRAGCYP